MDDMNDMTTTTNADNTRAREPFSAQTTLHPLSESAYFNIPLEIVETMRLRQGTNVHLVSLGGLTVIAPAKTTHASVLEHKLLHLMAQVTGDACWLPEGGSAQPPASSAPEAAGLPCADSTQQTARTGGESRDNTGDDSGNSSRNGFWGCSWCVSGGAVDAHGTARPARQEERKQHAGTAPGSTPCSSSKLFWW